MSVRRALVDCAVLSLQDACVFYPCCKCCFSKLELHQQDTTRYRCSRCGHSCLREEVEHRYRLSVQVARDSSIFGVTVFGSCLNPFFGIPANGLQRLLADVGEPIETSTRWSLLVKAVADCFIGRHFIFGLKLTDAGNEPWRGRRAPAGSVHNHTAQFVANQMILPKAACLAGCTVLTYYRMLLHRDTESTRAPLLPSPCCSPASSFIDATLPASPSLLRLQSHDGTLTPTPPWQQSLGLVTSSAEQEEACSGRDCADESSRLEDDTAERCCLEKHKLRKRRASGSLLCVERRSCTTDCLTQSSDSVSCGKAEGNTSILDCWSSPSQPGHRGLPLSFSMPDSGSGSSSGSFPLPDPWAWDHLPLSESLTEFLCDENNDFNQVCETEPCVIAPNQNETTRSNPTVRRSQIQNSSRKSVSTGPCESQLTHGDKDRKELVDITNTTHQTYQNLARYLDHSNLKEEEAGSSSFDPSKAAKERLDEDVYDCSADLFSISVTTETNTKTPGIDTETCRRDSEHTQRLMRERDENMVRLENSSTDVSPDNHRLNQRERTDGCEFFLTPDKQELSRDETAATGFQWDYPQHLDFFPPSQSTPVLKEAPKHPNLNSLLIHNMNSKHPARLISPLCKLRGHPRENTSTPERCRPRFTPNSRSRRSNRLERCAATQRSQAGIKGSPERTRLCFDPSAFNQTVCERKDNEATVPPTTQKSPRQSFGSTRARRNTHRLNCKRSLLDHTAWIMAAGLAQRGNTVPSQACAANTAAAQHGSVCEDESQTGNWSRDLFSDSV